MVKRLLLFNRLHCRTSNETNGATTEIVFEANLQKVTSAATLSMHTWVSHRLKPSWPEASLCGLAKVTDLHTQRHKLGSESWMEYKLHCTRSLRNLREHEGHSLKRDLPLSAEGLVCFETQKPRKSCEVRYLCSDPVGNTKGKCTYTHSTSSDLWSISSFCPKCSVITLLWSYWTWNVQKNRDWQDGIFKNAISKVLYLLPVFGLKINSWL